MIQRKEKLVATLFITCALFQFFYNIIAMEIGGGGITELTELHFLCEFKKCSWGSVLPMKIPWDIWTVSLPNKFDYQFSFEVMFIEWNLWLYITMIFLFSSEQ